MSHRRQAIRVRQSDLYFAVAAFAVTRCMFCLFSFSQIQDKGDARVLRSLNRRGANQNRDRSAILVQEFFLIRLNGPGRLQLSYGVSVDASPLAGRHLLPVQR